MTQRLNIKEIFISFILPFFSGFVIMTLEGLGFRILAPYYGYSVYVSGALIGVVMIALSIGYYYGGLIADKTPTLKKLFEIILIADIFTIISCIFYKDILSLISPTGMMLGSILSTAILFGPCMVLLSMVSPFLIKILSKEEKKHDKDAGVAHIGTISGKVYSISTIGSILGIFISTFILIPFFGSRFTFYFCFIMITLLLISYHIIYKKNYLPIFLLLLFSTYFLHQKTPDSIIFEKESLYNLVYVEEKDSTLYLKLNQPQFYHSRFNKENVLSGQYYDFFLTAPLIADTVTGNILVLGLGAGTTLLQLDHFYPEKNLFGVDIDKTVTDVGFEYFGLSDIEDLKIYVEDAKTFVKDTEDVFDVIIMDVYHGGPFIPFYLTTGEFFLEIYSILPEQGILEINLYNPAQRSGYPPELIIRMQNTIASIFPSVFYVDIDMNRVLFASKKKISIDEILKIIEEGKKSNKDDGFAGILFYTYKNIQEIYFDPNIKIFSDDLAPVESLTLQMLNHGST